LKHILVIRLSAMGDAAMTVPVIRAVVMQHPNVRITVVSRPFFKAFFEGIERVDFFAVDLKQRHKGLVGLIRLYKDLRKLNVDGFADLHNVLRSKVVRSLFSFTGKKTASLDKGRSEKKELTRFENKTLRSLKSMHQRYADVFEQLGIKVDLVEISFPEKEILSDKIKIITGEKSGKWIGIAPFAQYQTKVYPLDLMQIVIDKLVQNPDQKIFLFGGGKTEIEQLELLKKSHKNVIVVAGKIPFTDELKLISNLDVMLSMDSGNAHIASMYGVKTIVLFGATHPYAGFMPFGQPLENALIPDLEEYPKLPTSVYGNKVIDSYQDVMRSIAPQSVVNKIKSILA
jgi:ADP-heptose:LPS heptosyltransferase